MNKLVKNWRDAATLIICARTGFKNNQYKILMLKRSSKSKFMPDAYVFPGGVTSTTDYSNEWNDIFENNNIKHFDRIFNIQKKRPYIYTSNTLIDHLQPELAFRICALRETFEESGILLVRNKHGEAKLFSDPTENVGGEYGTLQRWREEVHEDASNFLKLFRCMQHTSPDVSIYEWSTWLTPTFFDKRFNTMFYICFVDNILSQSVDQFETVHSDWLTPSHALQQHFEKKLLLRFPQMYECNRMLIHNTFGDLKTFTKNRESLGLETWCPFKIKLLDGFVIVNPGDDYHNAHPNDEPGNIDATIEELRSNSKNLNRAEISEKDGIKMRNNISWYGHLPFGEVSRENVK